VPGEKFETNEAADAFDGGRDVALVGRKRQRKCFRFYRSFILSILNVNLSFSVSVLTVGKIEWHDLFHAVTFYKSNKTTFNIR
jgi:hypothetical protein